ncbi:MULTISPECIES: hypothetical protein [unclassified Rhizobium]|uniref:hypothetical protein n=1 Tax=unclassified Rhizobium TaxID=2613769 RepID=UPI001ADC4611|nr:MULTISPECIES: hypothetical protein [unclassified Rhizobium]MBO9100326.1 hypothetical protein [Rhizobium sp. L58/93]MBO9186219.1 hypothetical protein [Rhizobium sp. E27B/91]QXZ83138.1 hypothetical protein J5287_13795 [Rhizobium sp. K1/93]QXZ89350.1 hypothetical protein J5280_14795 [Rhizobium sp. K15/93]QYA01938.1 hypothetical protein J5278_01735 [Rhizobium sp. B21/90]
MKTSETTVADVCAADALSFMARIGKGRGYQYWTAEPTGSYSSDCARGRELAAEYLEYLGRHPTNGNASLLGPIVLDMIRSDVSRGLVVGFMGAVNEYAMSVARLLSGEFDGTPHTQILVSSAAPPPE